MTNTPHRISRLGIVNAYLGVEVLISEREAPLLQGDRQLHTGEPQLQVRGPYPGVKTQPTRNTWDRQADLDSARRLLELDPMRLAPGHGRPVDDPTLAMRRAIDAAARRS
jgi:hypothetical protein